MHISCFDATVCIVEYINRSKKVVTCSEIAIEEPGAYLDPESSRMVGNP